MSKEERFYTAEDLTGYDLNDRLYSESEVELIQDLFSEFYELNSDFYNEDKDEAFSDFFDAYSSAVLDIKDETRKNHVDGVKGNPRMGRAIATVAGAGVGLGVGKLLSSKDRAKKAILVKKVSSGTASKQDLKELNSLNRRINIKEAGSTIAGSGLALGATVLASKYNRK